MNSLSRPLAPLLLILLALAPIGAGCVAGTGTRLTFSGKSIDDDVMRRLAPGESKEFVLTLFGPPSSKDPRGRGSEVWKWSYHESSSRQNGLPGAAPIERARDGAVNVEFEGRTVVRIWRS